LLCSVVKKATVITPSNMSWVEGNVLNMLLKELDWELSLTLHGADYPHLVQGAHEGPSGL
jgi:hypothetical protein